MTVSTPIGSNDLYPELLAAVGDLGQNAIRVFLGRKPFHAADLKLEVRPHKAKDQHRARRAATAPIEPCDDAASVHRWHVGKRLGHRILSAAGLQFLTRYHVIAQCAGNPQNFVLETDRIVKALPVENLIDSSARAPWDDRSKNHHPRWTAGYEKSTAPVGDLVYLTIGTDNSVLTQASLVEDHPLMTLRRK